jgi:phenylpropionate dioxygenase-like ring-hydroxylating dioxygenase large terminal subunit
MYHGIKFGPDGACVEIPGQTKIPHKARVRTFPVVEKNNWIWVWMGEPEQADESLICFAVGYDDPDWNIKTSEMHVDANYRLEVANGRPEPSGLGAPEHAGRRRPCHGWRVHHYPG